MFINLAFLLCTLSFTLSALADYQKDSDHGQRSQIFIQFSRNDPTCVAIENVISNASSVYYPLERAYMNGIYHHTSSSVQYSRCTVEPGTVDDVSKIMRVLVHSTIPFGVKGGGHSTNAGFSSSPGILIAMTRLNKVTYNAQDGTADIQTGIIWDDVYAALAPYGMNVVGGRVTGVGVAGFMLGGGYSWLTNLHGLAVDTVTAFELVLPNSTVVEVRNDNHPDLFFGLKGGLNNFGIVTRFTLKTFPQTQIWAGIIYYDALEWDATGRAIYNFFINNDDPNANILPTYNIVAGAVRVMVLLVFYNKPQPPFGLFDEFFKIRSVANTVKTRDFLDFVKEPPSIYTSGQRGAFATVSLAKFSPKVIDKVISEARLWGLLRGVLLVSYEMQPFLRNITRFATPSAYSHDKSVSPLNIYFTWPLESSDKLLINAMKESTTSIAAVAREEGQDIDSLPLYPNYCLADTPLERMYGSNLEKLRSMKRMYDPNNVMGRAGGFKF